MRLSSQLSLRNTGGGLNESFNSFLTGAVIELNSHRRAGSSPHHKPFPPIRDVTEAAGRDAGQSEMKLPVLPSFYGNVYSYRLYVSAGGATRGLLYIFKGIVQHFGKYAHLFPFRERRRSMPLSCLCAVQSWSRDAFSLA